MIYTRCLDKKIEKGSIVEYKLQDFEGNTLVLSSEKLKGLIADGVIAVANLTLTADNKLRWHSIATLQNLNKSHQEEKSNINVDNLIDMNPGLLDDMTSKGSYTYQHKLFYVNKDSKLVVFDTETMQKKIIGDEKRKIIPDKIVYIQSGGYLSIFANYETNFKRRKYIGLEHILYDIYMDKYDIVEVYDSEYSKDGLYVHNHFNFNVNEMISLMNKTNELVPILLLYNRNQGCFYYINVPSKDATIEFVTKLKTFEGNGWTFDVEVLPLSGIELSMGPYTMTIDKKTKSGRLFKDR